MQYFFDEMYSLYTISTQYQYKFLECACSLSLRLNASGHLLQVQWISSSATLKMTVCWDVALCSLVEVHRCFTGACCLHHHTAPMTKAASTFVKVVNNIQLQKSELW
jgi:hypothetical protein